MRALTATLLIWLTAFAQQGPQTGRNTPVGSRGAASFGTTTQLVVEDVVIRSRDGKPLTGLKPSDFLVTEDGRPQKISVFEFQTLEEPAEPAPAPNRQWKRWRSTLR